MYLAPVVCKTRTPQHAADVFTVRVGAAKDAVPDAAVASALTKPRGSVGPRSRATTIGRWLQPRCIIRRWRQWWQLQLVARRNEDCGVEEKASHEDSSELEIIAVPFVPLAVFVGG